ncbi:MAG: 1-deoxy-D-xylulose-5-phosphate reductoisomerase [Oscillospiraceae bacterium]
MTDIVLLGSTGSIGAQTLDVCRAHNIKVKALSANTSVQKLEEQARLFHPEYVCIHDKNCYKDMSQRLSDTDIKVLTGMDGLLELAQLPCGTVVNSVVGMVGMLPTIAAAKAGRRIALANKETLVAGGSIVMDCVKANGAQLLPIDSEHSAIFQCLMGAQGNPFEKIYLTASGGPFFGMKKDELKQVTIENALNHPNWSMGAKITIDSATLMNKGLELIEAVHLFNARPEQIEIVVHRQSIIHSAVQFADGAVIAQLGSADMRLPIQLALTYPERLACPAKPFSLFELAALTFDRADEDTFVCLAAAKKAISLGGSAPCIINCANEAAVALFLGGKIRFLDIGEAVCAALEELPIVAEPSVDDLLETQHNAEEFVRVKYGGY